MKKLELNIQRFGGRGATSSNRREIGGVPVIKNARGYDLWNIGENAPKGYVGLVKDVKNGPNKTAYIKSKYANEFRGVLRGTNLNEARLNSGIKAAKTRIQNLRSGKSSVKGNVEVSIRRLERQIKDYETILKVRKDIYK